MTHEQEQDMLTEMGMIRNKMTTLKAVHALKMRAINKKAEIALQALNMDRPRVKVAIERLESVANLSKPNK